MMWVMQVEATLLFPGPDPELDQQDSVGDEEEDKVHQGDHVAVREHQQLHHIRVNAGQLDHLRNITEEVVKLVGASEGWSDGQNHLDNGM